MRLPKKTVGPVEIRLNCRRIYDPIEESRAGANWRGSRSRERLDNGARWPWPPAAIGKSFGGQAAKHAKSIRCPMRLRKDDVIAGFEYSFEPYSLSVKLTPRKTRINVEPEYVLLVDRGQVRLDGKLTYTIRGANVSTLEIAIAGWELDEVGPDSLVAVDGVTVDSGVVSIPLKRPSSGSIELRLRAHRAIEAKASSLAVPLPRPRGGVVGPTSLAVVAADNLELTPNVKRIEGLARQRHRPAHEAPRQSARADLLSRRRRRCGFRRRFPRSPAADRR